MALSTPVVLGVDIGTSSTKGALVQLDGAVVREAQVMHGVSIPQHGWAEHDAESVWWGSFLTIARELLAGGGFDVVGVGVSGIGPCVLPADSLGQPLRPAILYGVDTRATKQIEQLDALLGREAVLARCGSPLTTQAVGPKLLWLQENEPTLWARTRYLFMANSFLVYRLTGNYVLDHHSASQAVPLYDLHATDWHSPWCATIANDLEFPALLWSNEIAGSVTASAADATGIPEGTPVVLGTVDAWAEAYSVGATQPGDTMIMYGTTAFIVQVVDRPLSSSRLWSTAGIFPATYSLAGGLATSGAVTDWLRRLINGSFRDLAGAAAHVSAGANGLLVLPYFSGERTPILDPDARGLIIGLTLRHDAADIYRAVLEGTAFGIRQNLDAMSDAGGVAGRLIAVGGGTAGRLWPQIVSDVLGREQILPTHTLGAAFGDAMLAAKSALGIDVAQWNPRAETVIPQARHKATYDELYEAYRSLYEQTKSSMHLLAALQTMPAPSADGESKDTAPRPRPPKKSISRTREVL